jgi:hypothetical protein
MDLGPAELGIVFAVLIFSVGIPLAFGFWVASIGASKGYSRNAFFALGFFTGIIGLIIALAISPKAAPLSGGAPAWLADPRGRFDVRYFDGWQWTDRVARGGIEQRDPF